MAPGTTRAIGIFANSACVVSLTLRKSDRPLFPKADVQTAGNWVKLGSAFGQNQPIKIASANRGLILKAVVESELMLSSQRSKAVISQTTDG